MRGLVFLPLVACAPTQVTAPQPAPFFWASLDAPAPPTLVTTGNERAAAAHYLAALVDTDTTQLAALMADNAHFFSAAQGDVRGRDGIVAAHRALFGGLTKRQVALRRVLLADEAQSFEWSLQGVDASGQAQGWNACAVAWTHDNGKMWDLHVYLETATAPAAPLESPAYEQTGPVRDAKGLGTVQAMLDALEQRDWAQYHSAFTPDATLEVGGVTAAHGPQAIGNTLAAWHRSTRSLDVEVTNTLVVGPYVLAEYRLSGNNPSQNLAVCDVMRLRDGRVARVWRYANLLSSHAEGLQP